MQTPHQGSTAAEGAEQTTAFALQLSGQETAIRKKISALDISIRFISRTNNYEKCLSLFCDGVSGANSSAVPSLQR